MGKSRGLSQEEIESLIGMVKDKLKVIAYDGFYQKEGTTRPRHYYVCECSCGNITIKERKTLSDPKRLTASCGCNLPEKHGLSKHPAYGSFKGMMGRAKRPHPYYHKKYIEKHITVCDEWYDNPKAFIKWAEENGFKKGLTLERIDNEKGYSPENCKWATKEEQSNNRGDYNHNITYNGKTQSLAKWSRELGIAEKTLADRLKVWSVEESFTKPVDKSRSRTYQNKVKKKLF